MEGCAIMAEERKKYFDAEKQKKALEVLNSKWPAEKKICEVCGSGNWTLAEDLVMPVPFSGNALMIGGPTYPQVMVICNGCGNTKYFNAVMMGVLQPEKKGDADGDS